MYLINVLSGRRKIIKNLFVLVLMSSILMMSGCVQLIAYALVAGVAGSDAVKYSSFPSGDVGKMMNTSERKEFQERLKNDPMNKENTWTNKKTGNTFKLTKLQSFKKKELNCYVYKGEISNIKNTKKFTGRACLLKHGVFVDD